MQQLQLRQLQLLLQLTISRGTCQRVDAQWQRLTKTKKVTADSHPAWRGAAAAAAAAAAAPLGRSGLISLSFEFLGTVFSVFPAATCRQQRTCYLENARPEYTLQNRVGFS